ncbi:response regulator [Actinomadura rayongensis]|uniref:Transcriptional regulatory protein n=1 Tax=Actinomadura rayongensis TaxID=1429076 RepID=A0A6I4W1R1_9ACTN|nr:response regulator [Actinomadura rayongensis]MXQ63423.1 response regulator [Actinomadura rayongensis]
MIRVLVVDDDYRVADLHARFVAAVPGFETVGIAHTAAAALRAARRDRPDLVLLDQYLPDTSGTEIIGALGCEVIMLTAAGDAATVRRALAGGAVNYLVKPFTQRDLADRLAAYARYRAHLDGSRPLDQSAIDRAVRLLHQGDRLDSGARKGRSAHTAGLVGDAVRTAGRPTTATEIADRLGLSRATAQRYLADLAADGRVSVRLRYGSTGRPEHRYSWTGDPAD